MKEKIKTKAKELFANCISNTPEWLEKRRKGIGGSDAAQILGISGWGGPVTVWNDKLNIVPKEILKNEAMEWGHRLEPAILEKFKDENPILNIIKTSSIYASSSYDFIIATPDSLIVNDENEVISGLEVKNVTMYKKDEFEGDTIPDSYMLQIQHYMYVFDVKYWYIAYLIGGNTYFSKTIKSDDELIEMMIQKEIDFWFKNICCRKMPDPCFADSTAIKQMLMNVPIIENEPLALDNSIDSLVDKLSTVKDNISKLEIEKETLANRIKLAMGSYVSGYTPKYRLSYKPNSYFNESILQAKYPDLYKRYQINIFDKETFKKENAKLYKECSSFSNRTLRISLNKE